MDVPSQADWQKDKVKSEPTEEKCPKCGKILNKIQGKGANSDFFGCSGYPECNYTKSEIAVLPAEDYIGRIVKLDENIEMQTYNSWKARSRITDMATLPKEEKEFRNRIEILIYGLKSKDPMVDVKGKDVPPLVRRVWKNISPTIGFKTDNTPSAFRALLAYSTGQDAAQGFRIGDVQADVVGKYLGINLAINKKQTQNTLVRFSPLPKSFTPDLEIEKAAMEKYEEKQREATTSSKVKESDIPNVNTEEQISEEDLPF